MPELSITESQKERFDALREELAAEHAGPYASVRPEDVFEYLLDLAEEADQEVPATSAAGGATEEGSTGDGTEEAEPTTDEPGADEPTTDESAETTSPGPQVETVEESAPPSTTPDPGGGGLDGMLNLLERHDDKWREASGDERYEVELEDGSVETARTKDDVKAILFKHY